MRDKTSAHALLVSGVRWNIFGTLTFRGGPPSEESASLLGPEWAERMRCRLAMPQSDFFWFVRVERGEHYGRVHLHVLLRVHPSKIGFFLAGPGRLSVAHKVWARGMTTFRVIGTESDPAIDYVLKVVEEKHGDTYEFNKFSKCTITIPSPALLRTWAPQMMRGEECKLALSDSQAH